MLALRDFHAENLVWRPEREGTDRLGLLDFQDAVLAPPEYDLASLLRDARRDIDDEPARGPPRPLRRAHGARSEARVAAAAAVLGVQRNLRILGVFARLARERGQARLPRPRARASCAHLAADLAHPALRAPARAVGGRPSLGVPA